MMEWRITVERIVVETIADSERIVERLTRVRALERMISG